MLWWPSRTFHLDAPGEGDHDRLFMPTELSGLRSASDTYHSVGRPKHPRVMAGAIQDNLFIGRRAQELRGLLKIKYPMEHGVVTDWDDMERIWGWVYGEGLKALSEEVSSQSFGPVRKS